MAIVILSSGTELHVEEPFSVVSEAAHSKTRTYVRLTMRPTPQRLLLASDRNALVQIQHIAAVLS